MSKEKNTVELKDEELEKVSGGKRGDPNDGNCPKNLTQCGSACAGCNNLVDTCKDGIYKCCLRGILGEYNPDAVPHL